ncbi:MAG: Na+/H+ antiporter NhaA, partial [Parascardovia denticolens]
FNAGVDLRNVSVNDLTHPVVLGVALGLIIGKQIGIFGCTLRHEFLFWSSECGLTQSTEEDGPKTRGLVK